MVSEVVVRIVEKNAEVLQEFGVAQIPAQDVQLAAKAALDAVVESVKKLADDNPADAEQIREIWLGFINQDATELFSSQAIENINKINNEALRDVLLSIVPVLVLTLKELTDGDEEDNQKVIIELWTKLATDLNFLKKLLELAGSLF